MTAFAFLVAAALLGQVSAGVVELNCSDNATCIENMAREFARSIRQQKTVRLFDMFTVEPMGTRQARSNESPMARFIESHAFSFDWNDYTFRLWKAPSKNDALDLEVFESRSAKDVSEELPKKSKSKVEEEDESDDKKTPKGGIIKRRAKKKIIQAVIPMLFGMKTAGMVIFAMMIVTALTLKAWAASKVALIVTLGMAIKRLYESYSLGVGLQNHPYLYSQYPIDFPSASSHAYSVSGVSPQFPEMYNPSALGTHSQNELLPHNDASAQQSQQAPTLQLLNNTRATERWDGKSLLQKLLEPIVQGLRSAIDPIANVFYSMPATFRGLNSDVTTMKNEPEDVKKPREILVPQPRYIAQRKMNYRKPYQYRPKKYTELKVDLEKLKTNKDLHDYIKTKKYKHNYQNTYYYPRIKYFVNPDNYLVKPKNTRLVPYKIDIAANASLNQKVNSTYNLPYQWNPILVPVLNGSLFLINSTKNIPTGFSMVENKRVKRIKRSLTSENIIPYTELLLGTSSDNFDNRNISRKKDSSSLMKFAETLASNDPVTAMLHQATEYTKSYLRHELHSKRPPLYYTVAYEFLMMCLDVMDGMVQVHDALYDHFVSDIKHVKIKKVKIKNKNKNKNKNKKGNKHGNKNKKKEPEYQHKDDDDDSKKSVLEIQESKDKNVEN